MNTKRIELLNHLRKLVEKYIDDPELCGSVKASVEAKKVKYVLGEIDSKRNRPIESDDEELIKDIYFHFC